MAPSVWEGRLWLLYFLLLQTLMFTHEWKWFMVCSVFPLPLFYLYQWSRRWWTHVAGPDVSPADDSPCADDDASTEDDDTPKADDDPGGQGGGRRDDDDNDDGNNGPRRPYARQPLIGSKARTASCSWVWGWWSSSWVVL